MDEQTERAAVDSPVSQTIFHVHDYLPHQPTVKVKLERNSKGYNWEVAAEAESIDAVLALVRETESRIRAEYGSNGQQ